MPSLPDHIHRALFEASPDALIVVDPDGTIVLTNPACTELFGHSTSELEGASIDRLVPARFHQHRTHRDRYLADPRPRPMGMLPELSGLHRDGHEISIDVALTPARVVAGHLVLASVRDMRRRGSSGAILRVQATALRSAANGVVITDDTGHIVWVNPAATRITGYPEDELIGRHTRILKSGEHGPAFYQAIWSTVLAGQTWSGMIINRRKDGGLYIEEQTIAPVVDEAGRISHFIAIKQDVSERERARNDLARAHQELAERMREIEALNLALRAQATQDPLTGLYNRRYFHDTIGRDRARTRRDGEPLCLILIDVDHFKVVNDDHGHEAGDRVLVALAAILLAGVRASDLACRFGGEEFVVAMPGMPLALAVERVEAWRERFAATGFADGGGAPFQATFSAGVVALIGGDESIASGLARADAALYRAKHGGRDRTEIAEG